METTAHTSQVHRTGCPTREVLDRVADRWTTFIIGILAKGPHRYGEISRAAEDMNPRVLSRTLRGLERDGLIDRQMLTPQPPAVSYSLTEMGRTLEALVAPLRDWAEHNIDGIHAAQLRFDETVCGDDRTPWQH